MNIIGKDIAVTHGYVDDRGYGRGVWVTWSRPDSEIAEVEIAVVYDDETQCLRDAVTNGKSVAFVPYGHGQWYIHWADLGQLRDVTPPA